MIDNIKFVIIINMKNKLKTEYNFKLEDNIKVEENLDSSQPYIGRQPPEFY